jgi:ABC-type transport system involved in cytochrome c biogenesis permease subunit
MSDMKYRFTILNIAALVFLIACIIYTLIYYKQLSSGEGWGIVYMVGISVFGIIAFLIDFIIQFLLKQKKQQNIASIIALVILVSIFLIGN